MGQRRTSCWYGATRKISLTQATVRAEVLLKLVVGDLINIGVTELRRNRGRWSAMGQHLPSATLSSRSASHLAADSRVESHERRLVPEAVIVDNLSHLAAGA